MTRALLEADGAAGAFVVVVLVTFALAELDDGIVRAGAVTAVALKAIAAGQATLCLEQRLFFGQAADHFAKTAGALFL